ncbi:hypothetical protein Tco_0047363 [Tanacetum coccineum]
MLLRVSIGFVNRLIQAKTYQGIRGKRIRSTGSGSRRGKQRAADSLSGGRQMVPQSRDRNEGMITKTSIMLGLGETDKTTKKKASRSDSEKGIWKFRQHHSKGCILYVWKLQGFDKTIFGPRGTSQQLKCFYKLGVKIYTIQNFGGEESQLAVGHTYIFGSQRRYLGTYTWILVLKMKKKTQVNI